MLRTDRKLELEVEQQGATAHSVKECRNPKFVSKLLCQMPAPYLILP